VKVNELLESYKNVVGEEVIDQLMQLAEPLKNIKIVHVNSTPTGGGVAEILRKMVPLTEALGILSSWEVLQGNAEFYQCTKLFHNAIQGNKSLISNSLIQIFETTNQSNAELLKSSLEEADIVVIHDPQPIALISHFPKKKGRWIWRCHIDASKPFWPVWKYLQKFAALYDASIFSLAEFTHSLPHPIFIIPPSIDPLSDKNRELDPKELSEIRPLFGIDPDRPLALQVSRFDQFKDPLGVIEAYRLAKKFNPQLQLALAGGGASDDPEGEQVMREVQNAARGDSDIHILLLPNDAHRTINALQRSADIVLQKSTREGFGLTVTEALWKGKAVIGGNTGGIRLQIINGVTGFIINTVEGAAYRMRYLLQHPEIGAELGQRGRTYVRDKFLITRHLMNYLALIYSLLHGESDRIELAPRAG
jgi:trehalose synthase